MLPRMRTNCPTRTRQVTKGAIETFTDSKKLYCDEIGVIYLSNPKSEKEIMIKVTFENVPLKFLANDYFVRTCNVNK